MVSQQGQLCIAQQAAVGQSEVVPALSAAELPADLSALASGSLLPLLLALPAPLPAPLPDCSPCCCFCCCCRQRSQASQPAQATRYAAHLLPVISRAFSTASSCSAVGSKGVLSARMSAGAGGASACWDSAVRCSRAPASACQCIASGC